MSGRPKKLKIKIHPLFVAFSLGLILIGRAGMLVSYVSAVILHELAHSVAAEKYGYVLDELKLMPYGASINGEMKGLSTKEEVLILIAGPLFNIILIVLGVAVWWLIPASIAITESFIYANAAVGFFNLLPIYPLDGGKILNALFFKRLNSKGKKIIRMTGVTLSLVFAVMFVISIFFGMNISLIFIAVFMLMSALDFNSEGGLKRHIDNTYKRMRLLKGILVRHLAVSEDTPVSEVYNSMSTKHYNRIIILDGNGNLLAELNEKEFGSILENCPDVSVPIMQEVRKA